MAGSSSPLEFFDFHVHSTLSTDSREVCRNCQDENATIIPELVEQKLKDVFKPEHGIYSRTGILWILKGWWSAHFAYPSKDGQRSQFRIASQITQMYPGKILGLCGLRLVESDILQRTKSCLSFPGLVGVKLYPDADSITSAKMSFDPSKDEPSRNFERVLSVLESHKGMVLMHFPYKSDSDTNPVEGEPTSVQNLLTLMSRYPNATLVIAHSGTMSMIGLDGLIVIGKYFREHPKVRPNIYIETSGSLVQSVPGHRVERSEDGSSLWPNYEKIVVAWREFGIDRILAGSDYPLDQSGHNFIMQDLVTNPYLSDVERKLVLTENAKRLIGQIKGL